MILHGKTSRKEGRKFARPKRIEFENLYLDLIQSKLKIKSGLNNRREGENESKVWEFRLRGN